MSVDNPIRQMTLIEELNDVASTRVNALPSVVAERFAALRWRLERVDELVCDGYATEASPVDAGVPIETKAVQVTHQDRIGRFSVHPETHDQLLEKGGVYAIVLYSVVDIGDQERIVVLEAALVDAEEIDRFVPSNPLADYAKVRWNLFIDEDDVDVERWSR